VHALVTSAAGFIGSHVVEALVAQGDTVIGIECLTPYYDVEQKKANTAVLAGPAVELVDADLRTAPSSRSSTASTAFCCSSRAQRGSGST
jgi:UDP-glucuronate 4-epimerase